MKDMKAMSRDSSARERDRIREEKEMQSLIGNKSQTPTSRAGFKKISTTPTPTASTGWKTVDSVPQKSEAELRWGNNGEDLYDPVYPTPA